VVFKFTDGSGAGISFIWPDVQRLDVASQFYPADGGDSKKIKIPLK
jgi:hypothetical protein